MWKMTRISTHYIPTPFWWLRYRSRAPLMEEMPFTFKRYLNPPLVAWAIIFTCAGSLYARYPGKPLAFQHNVPGDFGAYLKAWDTAHRGQDPYFTEPAAPYKYSPGMISFVRLLPEDPQEAWFVFGALSLLGLVFVLVIGARYESWRAVGALLLGLGLAWKGFLETLDYGQLEFLILAFAVGATLALRRFPFFAGFLAGILPGFKLPWVLLLLPLLLKESSLSQTTQEESLAAQKPMNPKKVPHRARRRGRVIAGYLMACFLWGAAIPSLMFGSERAKILSQSWVATIRHPSRQAFILEANQSIWASCLRIFGGEHGMGWLFAALLSVAIGVLLIIRTLDRAQRRLCHTGNALAWISPWLLFTHLISPLAGRWGSVFVLGQPLTSLHSPSRPRIHRALGLLILAAWLLQQNPVVQSFGITHWTIFHPYGVITLFWILLLLIVI